MKRRGTTLIEVLWLIASIAMPVMAGSRAWHHTHSALLTVLAALLGLLAPTAVLYGSVFLLGKLMAETADAQSVGTELSDDSEPDDCEAM